MRVGLASEAKGCFTSHLPWSRGGRAWHAFPSKSRLTLAPAHVLKRSVFFPKPSPSLSEKLPACFSALIYNVLSSTGDANRLLMDTIRYQFNSRSKHSLLHTPHWCFHDPWFVAHRKQGSHWEHSVRPLGSRIDIFMSVEITVKQWEDPWEVVNSSAIFCSYKQNTYPC